MEIWSEQWQKVVLNADYNYMISYRNKLINLISILLLFVLHGFAGLYIHEYMHESEQLFLFSSLSYPFVI